VEELPLDLKGNVAAVDAGVGPVVDGGEGEGSVVAADVGAELGEGRFDS